MADKIPKYPVGTQLHVPDGSIYIYVQASEHIPANTYVDLNANKRLSLMRDAVRFPWGITTEEVEKEHYTFVMVRAPQTDKPAIG
jgi:hypothetical protein